MTTASHRQRRTHLRKGVSANANDREEERRRRQTTQQMFAMLLFSSFSPSLSLSLPLSLSLFRLCPPSHDIRRIARRSLSQKCLRAADAVTRHTALSTKAFVFFFLLENATALPCLAFHCLRSRSTFSFPLCSCVRTWPSDFCRTNRAKRRCRPSVKALKPRASKRGIAPAAQMSG